MRKDIQRINEANLCEALTLLGYIKCNKQNAYQEWRRHQFHLFLRKKHKGAIALSIHEDMPSNLPPFHRARHKSKPLEYELNKIIGAYQAVRCRHDKKLQELRDYEADATL
jgi:hypothetical protein